MNIEIKGEPPSHQESFYSCLVKLKVNPEIYGFKNKSEVTNEKNATSEYECLYLFL